MQNHGDICTPRISMRQQPWKLYHNVHNPLVPRLISQSLDSCQLRDPDTPASQHPRPAADCGIGLTPVTRVHVTTRQDPIVDGAGPAAGIHSLATSVSSASSGEHFDAGSAPETGSGVIACFRRGCKPVTGKQQFLEEHHYGAICYRRYWRG